MVDLLVVRKITSWSIYCYMIWLLLTHDGSISTSWYEHISDQYSLQGPYAWTLQTGWLSSTHTWILCQLQAEERVPVHSLPVLKPLCPFHAMTSQLPKLVAPLQGDSESCQTGLQSTSRRHLAQCLELFCTLKFRHIIWNKY